MDFRLCDFFIHLEEAWRTDMAMFKSAVSAALLLYVGVAVAAGQAGELTNVKLDQGTVVGTAEGSVEKFLGIPYASPP